MLFAAAAPVFACSPENGTFTQYIFGITTNPGTARTEGNVQCVTDFSFISYLYGAPWGNSISSLMKGCYEINTVSLTGNMVAFAVDTYAKGTIQGVIIDKFDGLGMYTYNGPTLTFALNGVTYTVTQGMVVFGLLDNSFAFKHGTTGWLRGVSTTETTEGVTIVAGPLAGLGIETAAVTYCFP